MQKDADGNNLVPQTRELQIYMWSERQIEKRVYATPIYPCSNLFHKVTERSSVITVGE